eukprot:scaffold7502_cov112-Isochrysis_galbana.AAC.2
MRPCSYLLLTLLRAVSWPHSHILLTGALTGGRQRRRRRRRKHAHYYITAPSDAWPCPGAPNSSTINVRLLLQHRVHVATNCINAPGEATAPPRYMGRGRVRARILFSHIHPRLTEPRAAIRALSAVPSASPLLCPAPASHPPPPPARTGGHTGTRGTPAAPQGTPPTPPCLPHNQRRGLHAAPAAAGARGCNGTERGGGCGCGPDNLRVWVRACRRIGARRRAGESRIGAAFE